MLNMDNIVRLEREGTVKDHIEDYIGALETETTKIRYRNDISRFLQWKFKNTPVEHLQYRDISGLTYSDMKKFQTYLRKRYANSTVNGNMYALTSLFKELKRIRDKEGNRVYDLSIEDLQVKKLKENKEEYGYVEWDELSQWIEYLLSLPESQNPKRKAAFVHIARMTGMRKQALSDMKFKDLKQVDGIWTITHYIKSKKHIIPIQDKDAEILLELKQTSDPNEKILKMSTKTMERILNQIREHFEIPSERKIVLHSIRGEAGYEAYLSSGKDILAAQQLLGHESIETTFNYIKKRESISTHPSLYMNKDFDDMDCVNELDKEDWQEVFNRMSRSSKYEVAKILKEMNHSQE